MIEKLTRQLIEELSSFLGVEPDDELDVAVLDSFQDEFEAYNQETKEV